MNDPTSDQDIDPKKSQIQKQANQASEKSEDSTTLDPDPIQNVPTPDQNGDLELLRQELETTKEHLQNLTVVSQRALADLQNYKRRTEEEKGAFLTFANADLLASLLPAIDNLNRALTHEPKNLEWIPGAEQSMKQLFDSLEKAGLKKMSVEGQKFDPNFHEALMTSPGEKDLILKELESGYTYAEKVIKRARVLVGDGTSQ